MAGSSRGIRACPICPKCGWKKFKVIENNDPGRKTVVTVECLNCNTRIVI